MLQTRIIPCLLLQDDGLVKTLKFKKPKYVGDPINAIRIFNEKEVDELIVLDILASKRNSGPNYKLIKQIAEECFMPFCYGGGIKTIEQADRLFAMGVEKLSIQTSALENPALITQITDKYGSQSLVVSVDLKKNFFGKYRIYNSAKNLQVDQPWVDYLQTIVAAGAGEILLNMVDLDGTMSGMEFDLIAKATKEINIPIIAMGGMSSLEDIRKAVAVGASAVAAGAYFVFQQGPHRAVLITYPTPAELEKLF